MAERRLGFTSDTIMMKMSSEWRTTSSFKIPLKEAIRVNFLKYLGTGRFFTNSSHFTTSNQFGWIVTCPGVIMTRSREVGLAVWERSDNLDIESDRDL